MTTNPKIIAIVKAQIDNMTEEELRESVFLTLSEQYTNAPKWFINDEYKIFVESSR